jgi:acyl-[acyl-carrier-protein]-phospholipid O-acyltransferase/long-chain-fatty-acid--[acyl-carrier-protein] ligase
MILTTAVVGTLVAAYVAVAIYCTLRLGLSLRQALLYVPFKLAYRIQDHDVADARRTDVPVVFVVLHESRLDPALMLSLLPDDTLHILDEYSARAAWLEPWRDLARTMTFNASHVFVSRRLVRVLKRKGHIAVYLPADIEPDTRTFRLYRAISRIAAQGGAMIVPLLVDGARQSRFSLADPKDAPRRLFPRLRVTALPGMAMPELMALTGPGTINGSNALFDRMAELRLKAGRPDLTLFQSVRASADRYGVDAPIVEDTMSGAMSYRRLLMAARIFAGRFARMTAPGEAVGLLLPNSNAIAISALGLASAGRTVAMLNYTAGPAAITAAVRIVPLRLVVSSRVFVEKAGLAEVVAAAEAGGARIIWVEDLRVGIGRFDMGVAALFWRSPVARQDATQPALIMYTSGSEGAPKAVVLTHANLVANARQVEARIAVGPRDKLINVLPVFHCFGLTGGLVLPLLAGVPVMLYPSPLHTKIIPRLTAKIGATILFGTDTFLSAYARTASDKDFSSLRLAVAGAEPLRSTTRQVWRDRFGVAILEGYGLTEAAPVVAVNTATHNRDGTVGRLLPGMRARIEPVEGIADGGRLHVSGPNVMSGYITADRPGVLQHLATGWHDTGDIVSVDREGYLTIRGRARRFAKIAGEMVSLAMVEMLAASAWSDGMHAAVAVPDPKRGERILLVTTEAGLIVEEFARVLREAGLPDIAVPHEIVVVAEMPLLATGKIDHAGVGSLVAARQAAGGSGDTDLDASVAARRA